MENHIIRHYVRDIPDAIFVCITGRNDIPTERRGRTDSELINIALEYWKREDIKDGIAAALYAKYNLQVFIGYLPDAVSEWHGIPGMYAYVYKKCRKNGKWQIKDAVPCESMYL
jgi:hypothetical protein